MNDIAIEHIVSGTLLHLCREYPHFLSRVFESVEDLQSPRQVHPVFYGSFDWHSSVHSHWLLLRALDRVPDGAHARTIVKHFNDHFTPVAVEGECAFFRRSDQAGFERPYGWAWLLKLSAQLKTSSLPQAGRWYATLAPLAELVVRRLVDYLPKLAYPIQTGQHNNTAFTLLLGLDYARALGDDPLERILSEHAISYFAQGPVYPEYEPGGEDFLSPTWQRALLMQRVLEPADYHAWLSSSLPLSEQARHPRLFIPVQVTDRRDERLAHLDGLNFSRAWCMREIARSFPSNSQEYHLLTHSARQHVQASQPHIYDHYMGGHWLATYLFLALDI